MPDRDLNDMLRRWAARQPAAPAFVTADRQWTFGQVHEATSRIAQGLLALGVRDGDRVACLTRHVIETTLLTLAACKIGAVCMPVNWRLSADEVAYILANGEARFVLTDAMFAATARKAAPADLLAMMSTDTCDGLTLFESWYRTQPATDPGLEPDPEATALQLYSSGTTGLPKGV
ncbi:MAG TPA: AMP-binding protein, partial [Burkholderiaceae bacterium]|nr:AMP-binding protein [Burkholderiaceae bacterium]